MLTEISIPKRREKAKVKVSVNESVKPTDNWHNSNQILRWTAAGLLEIEPRLHKISGI